MRHTPGTWKYVNGEVWSTKFVAGRRRTVRKVTRPYLRGIDSDEFHANGELIAAAPEMLEALDSIRRLTERLLDMGTEEDHSFGEINELARVAVVKATMGALGQPKEQIKAE